MESGSYGACNLCDITIKRSVSELKGPLLLHFNIEMNYRIEQKCILYLVLPELLFRFVGYVTKEETTGYNVMILSVVHITYLLVPACFRMYIA